MFFHENSWMKKTKGIQHTQILLDRAIKWKESKSIYIAPFIVRMVSNCLDMAHTVLPANYTMPAFPRKRSPDGATLTGVADIQVQFTTRLSTSKGWKAELAWLVDQ